jgi:Protein of unknown function (DUF1360)
MVRRRLGKGPVVTATVANPAHQIRAWATRQAETYRHGEDRPLGGYLAVMSAYSAGTAAVAGVAKLLGREGPEPSPWDLVLMALCTQKVSRLVAKDPITSPVRAPFTSYRGLSAPGELAEEVRGHGLQHSLGELLTCPMCVSQWAATALSVGLVVRPRLTRRVMATFAAVGGADLLQHAYVALQQLSEE